MGRDSKISNGFVAVAICGRRNGLRAVYHAQTNASQRLKVRSAGSRA